MINFHKVIRWSVPFIQGAPWSRAAESMEEANIVHIIMHLAPLLFKFLIFGPLWYERYSDDLFKFKRVQLPHTSH